VLLVKPGQLHDGRVLKFEKGLTPTRALPYLAAFTPPEFQVRIVDEGVEEINFDSDEGLVGITTILSQVPRAVQIADSFRSRGARVVIGGVGASAVPEDVLPHVDSLVVGEAESVWPGLLQDYLADRMKKTYRASDFSSLAGMPRARYDLLNPDAYVRPTEVSRTRFPRIPIETSRGCPHDCAFCSVTRYFGRTMRFRPIDDVIAEMRSYPDAYFYLVDDNIGARPDRSKELFRRMAPLGNKWVGQFSELAARDPELLDLARRAGCINAFIGVESVDPETLRGAGKTANLKTDLPTVLKAFKRAGIDVNVSLIVGFDTDTPDSIDRLADFVADQNVHLMTMFVLTPVPGTRLHQEMAAAGRILHKDYSLYDGTHAVFRPMRMTPEELERKYWEVFSRFYSRGSTLRRFRDAPSWLVRGAAVPAAYTYKGNSFYREQIARRIHPLCGGKARRGAGAGAQKPVRSGGVSGKQATV